MNALKAVTTVFHVILGAAALKAALTTLSRPMAGKPATASTTRTYGRRGFSVPVEGLEDDLEEALDYEDLL